MCRSHLKQSVCILAITALMLTPSLLWAQPGPSAPRAGDVGPLWTQVWGWLTAFVSRLAPAPPAETLRSSTAPVTDGGATGPSPGDWQCFDCALAGPGLDPDG